MTETRTAFRGAKVLLFAGDRLLVLRRDKKPGIDWPGFLDFPGGLREGDETPEACAWRETHEELGLVLPQSALEVVLIRQAPKGVEWFFAHHATPDIEERVVFGGEGEGWHSMPPAEFVAAQDAIPHFRNILKDYMANLRV